MPNPLFSFGPPDIFASQANAYQNSFQNPINSANMNSGWGIDPNLLTPSYQAPYRPQYSGTQPYNQYGRVGFFGGVNRLFNPFVREPMWGNPIDEAQPSVEAISNRPFDAAAWAGQRIAAPALAYGLAWRTLGPRSFMGHFTGQGVAAGLGRSIGSGLGRGLATGLGMGEMGAAMAGGAFGVAGSVAGSLAIPYAIAEGALALGQRGIWNPYINSRRASMDLRRNFAGVTFGDARGNAVSGGGLGYSESNRMASEIMHQGIQDMSFSTSEYTQVADFSARAGLLDNVKAKDITKRIKDVASQIKLIMAISKDPDIKNAIEELSKLNTAGADLTGGRFSIGAQAYQNLGRYASQAGVSVQRLMNTVGAQGQYLFQQNGMTPYLGQLAAGNAFAGFAAAQRTGLLNPATLARMGGVEGATQASLTGMINAGQTPYNMMALYNQYIGGFRGSAVNSGHQSLVGTLTAFGQQASRDPLGTIGGLTLYGQQMVGRQISELGSSAIENQVVSLMRSQNVRPTGPGGKYSAEQMVPYLQYMGMNPDEMRAFIAQRASEADPRTLSQRLRGLDRYSAEQTRQVISQNMLYGGPIGRTVRGAMQLGRNITSGIASATVDPVMEAAGWVGDKVTSGFDSFQFGSTLGEGLKVSDVSALFDKAPRTDQKIRLISPTYMQSAPLIGNMNSNSSKVIAKINELAKKGDSDAIAFLKADPTSQGKLLGRLIRNNKAEFGEAGQAVLNGDHPEEFRALLNAVNTADRSDYTLEKGVSVADKVTKAFNATVGSDKVGLADSMQVIGAAYDLKKQGLTADNIEDVLKGDKYAALRRQLGGKTGADALAAINEIVKRGAAQGTIGISNDAFNRGATLDRYKASKGKDISDPKLRGEFQKALAAGDDKRMNEIVVQDMAAKGGGRVLNQGLAGAEGDDVSDVMKVLQPMIGSDEQKSKLMDLVKSGRVDFAGAVNMMNSLDQKEATGKFSGAVDKFDQAVNRLNGTGDSKDSRFHFPSWLGGSSGTDTSKRPGQRGTE